MHSFIKEFTLHQGRMNLEMRWLILPLNQPAHSSAEVVAVGGYDGLVDVSQFGSHPYARFIAAHL
ncbi:hypothetical protein F2Q69_00040600 [Brassica cretica]|uniref:Uncharacterized protein n=1 Tax=Brassica cretica TaxID=69181 RepID=A0A8S9NMG0_BRACR|nr:hypothetical protein F2Q69_00040600 [Brassica cretica]